jgi:NitT/TauT family transport system substrate-binding protein
MVAIMTFTHLFKTVASRAARCVLIGFIAAAAHIPVARAEVKVGVSDWTGWVAWYVAQDQGYFRKYGADVKLVWFANYSDSISALSTGQLDANSQTWSDTLGPLAKGLPLKVVLVNDNSAGNDALMVGPKVRGFADLRGRTVALEQYSVSHFVLYTALAHNGLVPKDMNIVNLSAGDAAAAFMSGRVDAAVVWNPWISQIQKSGKGRPLFTSAQMPGLIPDLLVAQAKAVQNKRKDLTGMVRHRGLHPRAARPGGRHHVEGREHGCRAVPGVHARNPVLRCHRQPGGL